MKMAARCALRVASFDERYAFDGVGAAERVRSGPLARDDDIDVMCSMLSPLFPAPSPTGAAIGIHVPRRVGAFGHAAELASKRRHGSQRWHARESAKHFIMVLCVACGGVLADQPLSLALQPFGDQLD